MELLVGIDLKKRGSPSTVAFLGREDGGAWLHIAWLGEFRELTELSSLLISRGRGKVKAVALDAPLTLPPEGKKWRRAEEELMKMRIVSYSPKMKYMQSLHRWAKKIQKNLRSRRIPVYEVYPHATFSVLARIKDPSRQNLPPKKTLRGLGERVGVLRNHIRDFSLDRVLSYGLDSELYDVLDALAAGVTAHFIVSDMAIALGDDIWIPNSSKM